MEFGSIDLMKVALITCTSAATTVSGRSMPGDYERLVPWAIDAEAPRVVGISRYRAGRLQQSSTGRTWKTSVTRFLDDHISFDGGRTFQVEQIVSL